MNRFHQHHDERRIGSTKDRLLDEIAFFEARLAEMGHLGDCAYEKALARTYRHLLAVRRTKLSNLR